jgi:hypothetical protein
MKTEHALFVLHADVQLLFSVICLCFCILTCSYVSYFSLLLCSFSSQDKKLLSVFQLQIQESSTNMNRKVKKIMEINMF